MLIPINDEIWINPRNITKIVQMRKDVWVYSSKDVYGPIKLDDSSVEEVARFLNSHDQA
jgi:hypothetical protein